MSRHILLGAHKALNAATRQTTLSAISYTARPAMATLYRGMPPPQLATQVSRYSSRRRTSNWPRPGFNRSAKAECCLSPEQEKKLLEMAEGQEKKLLEIAKGMLEATKILAKTVEEVRREDTRRSEEILRMSDDLQTIRVQMFLSKLHPPWRNQNKKAGPSHFRMRSVFVGSLLGLAGVYGLGRLQRKEQEKNGEP